MSRQAANPAALWSQRKCCTWFPSSGFGRNQPSPRWRLPGDEVPKRLACSVRWGMPASILSLIHESGLVLNFPGEGQRAGRDGDSGPATSARSQVAPASESSGTAVTVSMNAVIGDVINRNRPGSCFVPGGLRTSCEAT